MSSITLRPAPPSKRRTIVGWLVGLAVVLVSVWLVDAEWGNLALLPAALADYIVLMASGVLQNPFAAPNAQYWGSAIGSMFESIAMAWVGTIIGALLSFPLGFLAARTIAPRPVMLVVRSVLNAIRAIPEVVLAIVVMLPVFGLGPLAGAFAIGVGSVGTLGKLTSEAIEAIDPGPGEAAIAAGARWIQRVRWSVLPQVLPEVIAFWLYRFEINIRASAILGVLGAGGVGAILNQLFQQREWDRIGITLFVIIVVTMLVDQASGAIRHRIIRGAPPTVGGAIV